MLLPSLSNIEVWIYIWALYFIPLIYMSVFMPVPCCFDVMALQYILILGSMMPPTMFFLKIVMAIWDLLCFHVNFSNICSSSVKYTISISIGIALNLQIALGSMDILMMLIFLIHENCIYFHLFVFFVSFFSVLQVFSEYRSFIFLVKFIPIYFIF